MTDSLEFALVIYVYDEDNDINLVDIDSVWTNDSDAIRRLKAIEEFENAVIENDSSKIHDYRYVLRGYSERFPIPDECTIYRENLDGSIHDDHFCIFCKRVMFNNKELLKPFDKEEYQRLLDKVKK